MNSETQTFGKRARALRRVALSTAATLILFLAGAAAGPTASADICVAQSSCGGCDDDGSAHVHAGNPTCAAVPTKRVN